MILFFWLIPLTVFLTTIPLLVPLPLSISDLYRKISPSSCSSPSHALGTTRHPSLPPIPSVHVMLQYLSDASRTRESFVYGPRMYTGTPFPDHLPLPAHLRPPPAFWNLSRVICSCTIVGTLVAHVQAVCVILISSSTSEYLTLNLPPSCTSDSHWQKSETATSIYAIATNNCRDDQV